MPEETTSTPTPSDDRGPWGFDRMREQRWWRGGLIAAIVLLAFATLYNGASYRRLARSQQRLVFAMVHQSRSGFGPMAEGSGPFGPPSWQGYGPRAYGPAAPWGPWAYGRGGCGHGWRHHQEEQQQGNSAPEREQGQNGLPFPQPNG